MPSFKFIDPLTYFMGKALVTESIQTYITKPHKKKLTKKWRNAGYISESDYLRDLVRIDLKK